jgi:hypothetical protein
VGGPSLDATAALDWAAAIFDPAESHLAMQVCAQVSNRDPEGAMCLAFPKGLSVKGPGRSWRDCISTAQPGDRCRPKEPMFDPSRNFRPNRAGEWKAERKRSGGKSTQGSGLPRSASHHDQVTGWLITSLSKG